MKKSLFLILIFMISSISAFAQEQQPININLFISVDWEGFSLDQENIEAFKRFRNEYPEIKIIHFLNAAYFTKSKANASEIAAKIKSVLRDGDELGLHIHALESLLKASNVPYRDNVTFWGDSQSNPINGERGHDVPLSLFNENEMRKLIHNSLKILAENGFVGIKSFRAGGWIATPTVLEALLQEGINTDSSAVSTEILGLVAGPNQPIFQINTQLWPDQNPLKVKPYKIQLRSGIINEFPDNAALADYNSGEATFDLLDQLVSENYGKTNQLFFHYGFHQETASAFLPRVKTFLKLLKKYTQTYMVTVTPVTFADYVK